IFRRTHLRLGGRSRLRNSSTIPRRARRFVEQVLVCAHLWNFVCQASTQACAAFGSSVFTDGLLPRSVIPALLPPFPPCPAFPDSDYYDGSAAAKTFRGTGGQLRS